MFKVTQSVSGRMNIWIYECFTKQQLLSTMKSKSHACDLMFSSLCLSFPLLFYKITWLRYESKLCIQYDFSHVRKTKQYILTNETGKDVPFFLPLSSVSTNNLIEEYSEKNLKHVLLLNGTS